MAKAATHHLISSVAQGDLADECVAVAILPETIDTADNRENMPDADFSAWTPESAIADKIIQWSDGEDRPASGSLVRIVTKNGETSWCV